MQSPKEGRGGEEGIRGEGWDGVGGGGFEVSFSTWYRNGDNNYVFFLIYYHLLNIVKLIPLEVS